MQKTTKVASLGDPNIDWLEMGDAVKDYVKERDSKLVKVKAGQKATWFHLRRIPSSLFMKYVEEGTSDKDCCRRAFQCAVVKVENLVTPDGEAIPLWTPARDMTGAPSVTDDELDLFAPVMVLDVGSVAYYGSFLANGSGATSQPLPSSVRAMALMASHDAEKLAEEARKKVTESPAPETESPTSDA